MASCRIVSRSSLFLLQSCSPRRTQRIFSSVFLPSLHLPSFSLFFTNRFSRSNPNAVSTRCFASISAATSPLEVEDIVADVEPPEVRTQDTVEHLLTHSNDVARLMKMERRSVELDGAEYPHKGRWFPYLDKYSCGSSWLNSGEILEALDSLILDSRKERFKNVVRNRSYSVCLVVEGLTDFGNVSAAFRSADALGFQSVHVVSCDASKRYRENRHVSMGAEKWLDIELWNSTPECFKILKSRGYRIVSTHLGANAVSVYDMDWSCPTAIVVGNESRGISNEALELSDLHCSIPMNGMVDSFNVSVAAGILMHHAVCNRTSRLGCHGDLTSEERQILLAEFSLRHSKSAISIANELAKRKGSAISSTEVLL
uniref:tRNA/rRNA methyltransferase SpoU type domain-containing protein n=2 Tax=Cucumis sativus TaxID=3659 RepID=A0A0A0LC15_CUCSA